MNLPDKPSESFKKRNPHLYGLGRLEADKPKQAPVETLVRATKERKERKDGLGIVVSLLTLRRRLLDDDNSVGALKPLRDAISANLGIDDGDKRIKWQYGQHLTTGQEGVIVRIEVTNETTTQTQSNVSTKDTHAATRRIAH